VSQREKATLLSSLFAGLIGWSSRALGNICWEYQHLRAKADPVDLIFCGIAFTILIVMLCISLAVALGPENES